MDSNAASSNRPDPKRPWFSTKGQIAQLIVTILACIFGGIKAWPEMKNNEFLSLGALLFYLLVGLVLITVWVLVSTIHRVHSAGGSPLPHDNRFASERKANEQALDLENQSPPHLVLSNLETLNVWMSANSHLTILNGPVGPVNPDTASVCYVRNEVKTSSSRAGQALNVNAHLKFLPKDLTHSEYEVNSADWLGIGGSATIAPGKSEAFVLCCYQSGGVPSLVEASHGRARMTTISSGTYDVIVTLTWSSAHAYSKRCFHLLFDTESPTEAQCCDLDVKECPVCRGYSVAGSLS